MEELKDTLRNLRAKAFETLAGEMVTIYDDMDRTRATCILMDYEKACGHRNAVLDLWGVIIFANEYDQPDGFVGSTIGHDLNKENDKWLTPRSEGYRQEVFKSFDLDVEKMESLSAEA